MSSVIRYKDVRKKFGPWPVIFLLRVNYVSSLNKSVREAGMNKRDIFAVSSLLESISREDFAIHLYNGQLHRNPFSTVPFTPLYYVLNEVYLFVPLRPYFRT